MAYKDEVEARRKANTLTPEDMHFLRVEEVMTKNNYLGSQLIRNKERWGL